MVKNIERSLYYLKVVLEVESKWVMCETIERKIWCESWEFISYTKEGVIGCSIWKGLFKVKRLFFHLTILELGNGLGISFWNEWWCTKLPLSTCFPLFILTNTKNATVGELVRISKDGMLAWDMNLPRRLLDDAIEEVASLNIILERQQIEEQPDELIRRDGTSVFIVKTCYHMILNCILCFHREGVMELD